MATASYDYVQRLLYCCLDLVKASRTYREAAAANGHRLRRPSLCSVAQRPNKETAVLAHRSRFHTQEKWKPVYVPERNSFRILTSTQHGSLTRRNLPSLLHIHQTNSL
ncbi:uncharacterized protein ISCGN_010304 [Ixodes scapularis]